MDELSEDQGAERRTLEILQESYRLRLDAAIDLFNDDKFEECKAELLELLEKPKLALFDHAYIHSLLASCPGDWYEAEDHRLKAESGYWDLHWDSIEGVNNEEYTEADLEFLRSELHEVAKEQRTSVPRDYNTKYPDLWDRWQDLTISPYPSEYDESDSEIQDVNEDEAGLDGGTEIEMTAEAEAGLGEDKVGREEAQEAKAKVEVEAGTERDQKGELEDMVSGDTTGTKTIRGGKKAKGEDYLHHHERTATHIEGKIEERSSERSPKIILRGGLVQECEHFQGLQEEIGQLRESIEEVRREVGSL